MDQRGVTSSFIICLKSLEMQSWCKCSFPLAMLSAAKSSSTVPRTRANALALSVLITQPVHKQPFKQWMASRLAWKDLKFNWRGQKMHLSHIRNRNCIWLVYRKPDPWIKFKVNINIADLYIFTICT